VKYPIYNIKIYVKRMLVVIIITKYTKMNGVFNGVKYFSSTHRALYTKTMLFYFFPFNFFQSCLLVAKLTLNRINFIE
jgi:hypothetical protein